MDCAAAVVSKTRQAQAAALSPVWLFVLRNNRFWPVTVRVCLGMMHRLIRLGVLLRLVPLLSFAVTVHDLFGIL